MYFVAYNTFHLIHGISLNQTHEYNRHAHHAMDWWMHGFVLSSSFRKLAFLNVVGIYLAKLPIARNLFDTGINISMTLRTINLTTQAPKYRDDTLNQLIETALKETTLSCLQSNSYKLAQTLADLECKEAIIESSHPIFPFLKNELKNFRITPIAV